MKRAAVLFLAALATTGCGRFVSADQDQQASTEPTVQYGRADDLSPTTSTAAVSTTAAPGSTPVADPLPTAAADAPGTGSVDVVVVDTEGTPRRGIPVQIDGPVQGTVVSDTDGHLRFSIKTGRYRATALEGCREQLVIDRGGGADVGVAPGQTTSGRLVVEVGLRYEPAGPVSYSGDAAWRVGEEHRVQLRLTDVCQQADPPSPAAYTAARFTPSEGIELVLPLSGAVGPKGTVEVTLRCTAADEDVSLDLVDAANPRWTRPILTGGLLAQQQPPFCVRR